MTAAGGEARAAGPPRPLGRERDFLLLWAGQSVSRLGSQVSVLAIPFVAVTTLGVGAFGAGLLAAIQFLPFLVLGLPAGAIVDRLPRRPVLVVSDLGRLGLLASVPITAAAGRLTLAQLDVTVLLLGSLTVFFDVAYQSYLPDLVGRERLVTANARLETTSSVAQLGGPSIAGLVIGAAGGAVAVALDAVSYAVSVMLLFPICHREAPPPAAGGPGSRGMRREIAEGIRYVVGHPLLRPLACTTATWNFFANMWAGLLVLYAVDSLGMSAEALGVTLALGGVGVVAGAALSGSVIGRIGLGPAIVAGIAMSPIGILAAVATPATAVPFLAVAEALGGAAGVVYNVAQVSLRQSITPTRMLGRLNATIRTIVWGTIPLGALVGGVLGRAISVRATVWIGTVGSSLSIVWLLCSPVPGTRAVGAWVASQDSDAEHAAV